MVNVKLGNQYQRFAPKFLRNAIRGQIHNLPSTSPIRQKLSRTFLVLSPDIESIYFDNFAVFPRSMQQRLLTAEFREQTLLHCPREDGEVIEVNAFNVRREH